MKESPNYYIQIPPLIWADESLSAPVKLFYGQIWTLSRSSGKCWATNQYFAETNGVTPRAISKWVKQLNDRGFIEVTYFINKEESVVERREIIPLIDPYVE